MATPEQPTEEIEPVRALYVRQQNPLGETVDVLRSLPAEIGQWWRDGHIRTIWLDEWQKGNAAAPGDRPVFWADDTVTINSWEDYKLWRMLGRVSDALILLLVLAVVLTVALALI